MRDIDRLVSCPVFYDFEASALDGYPIEIGWAFSRTGLKGVQSKSFFIRPPAEWPVQEKWDKAAEALHGITLEKLWQEGRSVQEIAHHMNAELDGLELFSDSPLDEIWLRQLFEAAGCEPIFTARRMGADILIMQAAAKNGLDAECYTRVIEAAARLAPKRHQAEADALNLAVAWELVQSEKL